MDADLSGVKISMEAVCGTAISMNVPMSPMVSSCNLWPTSSPSSMSR